MIYKTQKTKDRATRITLKREIHSGAPTWETVPVPHSDCVVKGKRYTNEKQWLHRANCKEKISFPVYMLFIKRWLCVVIC